jgi:hypothetical protein
MNSDGAPKRLGPEMFRISEFFFFILEHLHILRYLGDGTKSKHKIHLCFTYILYVSPTDDFI